MRENKCQFVPAMRDPDSRIIFANWVPRWSKIGEILMPNKHDDMKEKVQMYANAYGLDLLGWWVHGNELCITLGEAASPRAMFTKWFSIKRFNALVKRIAK